MVRVGGQAQGVQLRQIGPMPDVLCLQRECLCRLLQSRCNLFYLVVLCA